MFVFPSQGGIFQAVSVPSGSSWHSLTPVLLPPLTESSLEDLKSQKSSAHSCFLCRNHLWAGRTLGIRCIFCAMHAAESTGGKPLSNGYRGMSFEDSKFSVGKNENYVNSVSVPL